MTHISATWAHRQVGLGAFVELQDLQTAQELNGRRAVITGCLAQATSQSLQRWEVLCLPPLGSNAGSDDGRCGDTDLRRIAVSPEHIRLVAGLGCTAGAARLRLRNVPDEYDTDLLRAELDDEGFVDGESFVGLIFDRERRHGYLTAVSERVAMQIVGNVDGRRFDRAGPGRVMPDSILAQIVKVERL